MDLKWYVAATISSFFLVLVRLDTDTFFLWKDVWSDMKMVSVRCDVVFVSELGVRVYSGFSSVLLTGRCMNGL